MRAARPMARFAAHTEDLRPWRTLGRNTFGVAPDAVLRLLRCERGADRIRALLFMSRCRMPLALVGKVAHPRREQSSVIRKHQVVDAGLARPDRQMERIPPPPASACCDVISACLPA